MKKKNLKRGNHRFEDESDFNSSRTGVNSKSKSSKKRLSIYEDFEEDDDEFQSREKFRKKRK